MAIDTVSDSTVIEDLRTQDDKGIEPRKNMVEIKEKDIEASQTVIDNKKEEINQKESELQAEKDQLANDSGNLSDQEIASKQNEIAQKEQTLNQNKEQLKKEELVQQDRQEAVQNEREQIAKDENKLIENQQTQQAASSSTSMVPFLLIDNTTSDYLGRIALINTETGAIEKESSINTVRGRHFYPLNGNLLMVSGIDKASQSVRLIFLNLETLEVMSQGDYDVFSDSDILINGKKIYAVVQENDTWYVGRFNTELKLQSRSDQEVLSYTALQLNEGILYAQLVSGKIAQMSPDSLKSLGK